MRQTKIVATISPASNTRALIADLMDAGVNVFRLNFSHGAHEDHAEVHRIIRKLEEERDTFVAILADLQGPKIRIGKLVGGERELAPGDTQVFVAGENATGSEIPFPHPEIFKTVKQGDTILVDDGRIRLEVSEAEASSFEAIVKNKAILRDRKGVNLPDTPLEVDAVTKKDRADLDFTLGLGVDWVAMSFVQRAEDVHQLKQLVGDKAKIVAKIEKPLALENIDEILGVTDAIMVARGDLGVECDWYSLPGIQASLVVKCRMVGKPVIVATQMLESMITSPVPTRAETSDVANAVSQMADAVMLSAESAAGEYPIAAVKAMARIIEATETMAAPERGASGGISLEAETDSGSIASAASLIAKLRNACSILTYTETGATALRVSKSRCDVPILAVCPTQAVARQLALAWGVTPVVSDNYDEFASSRAGRVPSSLSQAPFIQSDRPVVVTSGSQHGQTGGTDSIKIAYLSASEAPA